MSFCLDNSMSGRGDALAARMITRYYAIPSHRGLALTFRPTCFKPGPGTTHDIRLGCGYNLENKTDLMCKETDNVFIELRNTRQGRPSGVMGTRCEVYSILIPSKHIVLWALTQELRQLCMAPPPDWRPSKPHCGDLNSQGLIVPFKTLWPQDVIYACQATPGEAAELDALQAEWEATRHLSKPIHITT